MDPSSVEAASSALERASALLIGAGAGMGVDSGLPDFRGPEGFWRAYPPYAKLGLAFEELANPRWFKADPPLAWGFYGHRMRLYRSTVPHGGFALLAKWARRMAHGAFVFTSNVDGQFQRAGFPEERIYEVHGSIHFQQCTEHCGASIFPAGADVDLDEATMRARPPLPCCPSCGGLSRPNILMFNDWGFDGDRALEQSQRFRDWLRGLGDAPLAVVECGAGESVPTVRDTCERVAERPGATLIRVNLRDSQVPAGHVGLAARALEGLQAIEARLSP